MLSERTRLSPICGPPIPLGAVRRTILGIQIAFEFLFCIFQGLPHSNPDFLALPFIPFIDQILPKCDLFPKFRFRIVHISPLTSTIKCLRQVAYRQALLSILSLSAFTMDSLAASDNASLPGRRFGIPCR